MSLVEGCLLLSFIKGSTADDDSDLENGDCDVLHTDDLDDDEMDSVSHGQYCPLFYVVFVFLLLLLFRCCCQRRK